MIGCRPLWCLVFDEDGRWKLGPINRYDSTSPTFHSCDITGDSLVGDGKSSDVTASASAIYLLCARYRAGPLTDFA